MNEPEKSGLRVVDANGQIVGDLERYTQPLEDIISGLQRDVRGWTMRFEELKRDKVQSAKSHPRYADAEIAFNEWKLKCGHKRSPFTADRFYAVLPFLENKKYGLKVVLGAINGAAYDAFEVEQRNGKRKRFDEWERIFKNAGSIEDYYNRQPPSQLKLAS